AVPHRCPEGGAGGPAASPKPPAEPANQPGIDWIAADPEHDRDGRGRRLRCEPTRLAPATTIAAICHLTCFATARTSSIAIGTSFGKLAVGANSIRRWPSSVVRAAQVFEETSDKARIGRGVEQAAFAWPRTAANALGFCRSRSNRVHLIIRGFAPASDLEQRNSQIGLGGSDWHAADDMGGWWVPSFCIPAPARKKCRKDVALEDRFGTAAQQRPPAVGEDKRFEFRPDPRAVDHRHLRFAQQEPKESIGP